MSTRQVYIHQEKTHVLIGGEGDLKYTNKTLKRACKVWLMWGGLAVESTNGCPYFQPVVENVDAAFLSSRTQLVALSLPA